MLASDVMKLFCCVDAFAAAMKTKLLQKAEEGYKGWDTYGDWHNIEVSLMKHIDMMVKYSQANEEIDIANLVMMIWNLKGRPQK